MIASFARQTLRLAGGALVAAGIAVGTASPSVAGTVRTTYGISLIGLPFGTATVTGTLEPTGGYRLELGTKLTGLASILSSSKGAASASGMVTDGHVRPATYATTTINSDQTRTVRMTVIDNAVDKVDIQPPWEMTPDRVPVTDADKRGIIDPMSALLMPVPAGGDVIGPASCNRTMPIFDGAARFDIELSFIGTRSVKSRGYTGPVAVCSARYHPIAGHRSQRPGTKFMADNKQIEVWLAPLGPLHMVAPYRISVLTMIGTLVIEATSFDTTGLAATR